MTFATEAWRDDRDESAIDQIERSLLGTCIVAPYLLDEAAILSARDFRNELRGVVFETLREFPKRRLDANLLHMELERRGINPPPGAPGWATAISSLLDHAVVCDDTVASYVRCIKEAAAMRRAGLLPRRPR